MYVRHVAWLSEGAHNVNNKMHNNVNFFHFLAEIRITKGGSRGACSNPLILKAKSAGGEANP
jgi:hypothetical protein